jgi:hypothetical protein
VTVHINYEYDPKSQIGHYMAHGTLYSYGKPMRVTGPGCADETLEFTAWGSDWPDVRRKLLLQVTVWRSMPASEDVEI